jgi:hypothetical protein
MTKSIHVTKEPVVLEGYQAISQPSKFGRHNLCAVLDNNFIERLEEERAELLKWQLSKHKNPKRATLKPEPWEEVTSDQYKIKFSWAPGDTPPIVDTEGTPIENVEGMPIYSGSKVKLAFRQKPYQLPDGSYGTSVKLVGIQIVALNGGAGVDAGDLDETEVAAIFGQTKGFKANDPNVTINLPTIDEDDDF